MRKGGRPFVTPVRLRRIADGAKGGWRGDDAKVADALSGYGPGCLDEFIRGTSEWCESVERKTGVEHRTLTRNSPMTYQFNSMSEVGVTPQTSTRPTAQSTCQISEMGELMTTAVSLSQPLRGRVALVTGAASGIGRASALAFARAGAQVVVADVESDAGEETVAAIGGAGGSAWFVQTDVTRSAQVDALVQQTIEAFGRLDYAHNNAGIIIGGFLLEDYEEDLWDAIMDVNLKGTWLCMKYEIPQMRAQRSGVIVNTSSVLGLRSQPLASAYVASKHGVVGLTRTAAQECAADGIRVNAVCPSWTATPPIETMFSLAPGLEEQFRTRVPLGRLATAEEVADAVVWLCTDAASFITGHSLVIDGGLTA